MNRLDKKKNSQITSRGYALMFAIIISGLVLAVGYGISSIVRLETVLSGAARESQRAFFAADGALECALFWDQKHPGYLMTVFATATLEANTSPPGEDLTPGPGTNLTCIGADIKNPAAPVSSVTTRIDGASATTQFTLSFPDATCARIFMRKLNEGRTTQIESKGYNTDCGGSDPRKLERAIRVFY